MELTEKQLKKYQLLHRKFYNEEISEEEATEQGENLADFFAFLSRPPDKESPP